jgi:hypothetical protein
MGQEARCTLRFGNQVSEGKALLETDELVFRGDGVRLKVPFKEMRSVEARDGELRMEFSDGPLVFQLGAQADKWAQKIRHPKSLLDKLGVKQGMKVSILGMDDPEFLAGLQERTENVSFEQPTPAADAIFVAANSPVDLTGLTAMREAISPNGAIWVVFRKGRKDFNENDILRGGLAAGLVDVKVVRFSDTHTASKFVIRKAERRHLR